jgi:hypothetical protein
MTRWAMIAALAPLLGGCAFSVNDVQAAAFGTPDVHADSPRRGEWIQARAEQDVVLGVTDNTDYVDHAYADLLSQCPGEIAGLSTRASTSLGFLSYTNVVEMRALCLR